MTGIIAAGGLGTRLAPVTQVVNKHLLLVYDKPMIYYPLATLISAGIKEVIIVSTSRGVASFKELLGDCMWLGIRIRYAVQKSPKGAADVLAAAAPLVEDESVAFILGDNVFIDKGGGQWKSVLQQAVKQFSPAAGQKKVSSKAIIYTQEVADPSNYGVIAFDAAGRAVSIEEKPAKPKSNKAVTGLYFYDSAVLRYAASLKPSERGEVEMCDINTQYLLRGTLEVHPLPDDVVWRDAGTAEGLLSIASAVASMQKDTGRMAGSIEEEAYINGWVGQEDLERLAAVVPSDYGRYIEEAASGKRQMVRGKE